MPTEEERRREYRPGYNPRGNYTSSTPNLGIWDTVKTELNALTGGVPGQPSFTRDVADVGRKAGGIFGGGVVNPQIDRLRAKEAMIGTQEPNFDRARRIEQAGFAANPSPAAPAPASPVMAQNATQPGSIDREAENRRVYNMPSGRGDVSPDQPLRESSRSSSSASVGVAGAGRGGVGPTISAGDQEYLNRQPVTADPRKRYFDMAQMSLEQREAYLNSLPEGQRPIQTIRGNKEGWYSPGMSKEFATIPEAMSGVEGRPTLKSEMGREEEARDRAAMVDMAGARNKTALAAEGMRQAGQDRRQVKDLEATLKGAKGANGKPSEEWKFEKNPTPEGTDAGVIVEKNSGMVLPVRMDKSKDIAAVFRNLPKTEWGGAASFLGRFDRETRNETFKYLSPEMKEEMIKYFESESAKGKQKKE